MTNFYPGLARGPVDHESTSVINVISSGAIEMGSAVILQSTATDELLARVGESSASSITDEIYGIAVGGDIDGIYGNGLALNLNTTLATNSADQGLEVVTQGRCLARVESTVGINIGDPLGSSGAGAGNEGVLISTVGETTSPVIARALQAVPAGAGYHVIAVDVQREAAGGVSEAQFQAFLIPQVDTSTTTTTTRDISDGAASGTETQTVPFSGTVGRILIGHSATIGNGFVNIKRLPNGVGPGVDLTPVNFAGATGNATEIVNFNQAFQQDDGLQLIFMGDGISGSTELRVTVEIEYNLT